MKLWGAGGRPLLTDNQRQDQRARPQVVPGEVQVGNEETFVLSKSSQALEQVAQGGGGVPVPGGVQGKVGRGAQGHVLVGDIGGGGMVGEWLDQMVLEGFSNLNDSKILRNEMKWNLLFNQFEVT